MEWIGMDYRAPEDTGRLPHVLSDMSKDRHRMSTDV